MKMHPLVIFVFLIFCTSFLFKYMYLPKKNIKACVDWFSDNFQDIAEPSILIFDLNTDTLIRHYYFNQLDITLDSILANIVSNNLSNNRFNFALYLLI